MYNFCPFCGSKLQEISPVSYKCSGCSKEIYLNAKPTATIIPIYKNEMMVSVRAIEPEKGKYDFIGGFLDYGEDPLDGAVRETKEETGLDIKKSDLHFLGIWIDTYKFQEQTLYTFNVIYTVKFTEKITPKGRDDVAELFWRPIEIDRNFAFKWMRDGVEELKKRGF